VNRRDHRGGDQITLARRSDASDVNRRTVVAETCVSLTTAEPIARQAREDTR
jgi:hypothetical protein